MSDRCHIIRDMLPLYLDGMLSEDSVGFVEEHLQGCGACREELEKLKAPDDFPRETPERDAAALKAMKRKWNRRVVLLGILLAAGRVSKVKILRMPISVYIYLIRSTPLMLQLLFSYFLL